MKRVFLPLFAVLLLVSTASAAEFVKWTKSLEAALKEAKERGTMVFVAEVVTDDPDNVAQPEIWQDPAFVKASRDFVCLFACPNDDTPTVSEEVDGKQVRYVKFAPGITRADHQKAWNDVLLKYGNLNTDGMGNMRMPFHFVIDADGKVLATIANGTPEGGFGVTPLGSFLESFAKLIRKYGRGLTAAEYTEFSERLEKAKSLAAEGKVRDAVKEVNAILERNATSALADQAKELLESISAKGVEQLEAAKKMASEDPLGAVVAMEQILEDFPGTEVAKQTKDALGDLKRDPRVKSALMELKTRKEAEKALAKAEEELADEDYARALTLLDGVAKKYAGTAVGEKAKARAEALRADEKIMAAVREQEAEKYCSGWLSMGRTYAKNGRYEKARELFQKVIDKFPGTSYAEEAAAELKNLP